MHPIRLISTVVLIVVLNASGSDRYVTLTAPWSATNTVEIAEGEVGELVSFPASFNRGRSIAVVRGGTPLGHFFSALPGEGGSRTFPQNQVVIAGPAMFALNGGGHNTLPPTFCTLRVFPQNYPPTGTVVIPPGRGGAAIGLQCSTDLVSWITATNGVYTNEPTAKFFRLNLERRFPEQSPSPSPVDPHSAGQGLPFGLSASPLTKQFLTWTPDAPGGAQMDIPEGQTAKVVSVLSFGSTFALEKNGLTFWLQDNFHDWSVKSDPFIVAGPARFVARGWPAITVEFLPNATDPQTTVIVPPGNAGGKIQLQLSTNLSDWASADPGIYTNLTAASFFRISLERMPR